MHHHHCPTENPRFPCMLGQSDKLKYKEENKEEEEMDEKKI